MITVAHVLYELGDGGVETMLVSLYENMDTARYRFVFVVHSGKRRYEDVIRALGGSIVQVTPLKDAGLFPYVRQLRAVFQACGADVVHCHNLTQIPVCLYAAKLAGVNVRIAHSHLATCFTKRARLAMPVVRCAIGRLATHRLACGRDAGEFLFENAGFTLVRNGIDVRRFSRARAVAGDARVPTRKPGTLLLHVGRLSPQKNHAFLVNVMDALQRESEEYVLACCGDGPERDRIDGLVASRALKDSVVLLGSRDDVPELMKAADVLLLPSLYEGLPVTLIEAQASGLACLVADTVDRESDLGLGLVRFLPIGVGDASLWAHAVVEVHACKETRPSPAKCERVLAAAGYDASHNARVLSELYAGGA